MSVWISAWRQRTVVHPHIVDQPVEVLPIRLIPTDPQRTRRRLNRPRRSRRGNLHPIHEQPQQRPVIRQRHMRPRPHRTRRRPTDPTHTTTQTSAPRRPQRTRVIARIQEIRIRLPLHNRPPPRLRHRRIDPRRQRHRPRQPKRRRRRNLHHTARPVERHRTAIPTRRRPRRPQHRPRIPVPRHIRHRRPRPRIKRIPRHQPHRHRRRRGVDTSTTALYPLKFPAASTANTRYRYVELADNPVSLNDAPAGVPTCANDAHPDP